MTNHAPRTAAVTTNPRPSICPTCGLTSDNGIRVEAELTSSATYVDTAGHLWAVTWVGVA